MPDTLVVYVTRNGHSRAWALELGSRLGSEPRAQFEGPRARMAVSGDIDDKGIGHITSRLHRHRMKDTLLRESSTT